MLRRLIRKILPQPVRHRLRVMLAPVPPYAEVVDWTDGIVQLLDQRILRLEAQVERQAREIETLRSQIRNKDGA
jgi:hypothetical protein